MADQSQALQAFLVESDENITHLEQELIELEQRPDDTEALGRAFRAIHTIKGTSAFFGLNRLEGLTHKAEDLLGQLRNGTAELTLERVGVLLETVDAVRRLLAEIRSTGEDSAGTHDDLMARLEAAQESGPETARAQAPTSTEAPDSDPATPESAVGDTTIRVDVELLDKLMNLVGELVLVRNQLLQHDGLEQGKGSSGSSQRLNVVTSELQEGLMKARMQPISSLWSLYPRLFRDMEQETGKKVKLCREGGDTELDRTLLQQVKDPLTHLVRNAVDHGLETPEARRAAGKPETGQVHLRATHQSGNVIVEIEDDGQGIDGEALAEKAVARGLITSERAARLSDREKEQLLFLPGLSTAAEVNNLSGRGVGMDVVKSNVERIGGDIEIDTTPGRGTLFRVKIPLTLAIISALVADCGGEHFAVPQVNVLEVVSLSEDAHGGGLDYVHGRPVYRLRGQLLPLVDLRSVLGLPAASGGEGRFVLVLRTDNSEYGLIVDNIQDTEEIVVKPLGHHFKEIRCFAGATIMGSGRVALILDAGMIAEYAELAASETRTSETTEAEYTDEGERESVLVFTPDEGASRAGIHLSRVARLEEFNADRIEFSGGREVIQYRGGILPLVRLDRLLRSQEVDEPETLQVVVLQDQQGDLGLVVGAIVDIFEEALADLRPVDGRPDLLGSAVVNGRVTDLIDTDAVVATYREGTVAAPLPTEVKHD